jgi:hypothetical protein
MPLGGSSIGSTPVGGAPRPIGPTGETPPVPFQAAAPDAIWHFGPRAHTIILTQRVPEWTFVPRAAMLVER